MQIIKINPKKPNKKVINQAVKILKEGGTVVYPTDTAYGLGADVFNLRAIKKVFKIKGRSFKKPLSVMVASVEQAQKIAKFDSLAKKIFKKFLPGPLTVVLKKSSFAKATEDKKKIISDLLTAGGDSIGIRVPDDKVALALIKGLGGPITTTSANISGKSTSYSVREVLRQFKAKKSQPDLVLDAGSLPKGGLSTIINVLECRVDVLREGVIEKQELQDFTKTLKTDPNDPKERSE